MVLSLVGEDRLRGRDTRIFGLRRAIDVAGGEILIHESFLDAAGASTKHRYELRPVRRRSDPHDAVVLDAKCLTDPGPSWPHIQAALEADATELRWAGRILKPTTVEIDGKPFLAIAESPDPTFKGVDPVTRKEIGDWRDPPNARLIFAEGASVSNAEMLAQVRQSACGISEAMPVRIACGVFGPSYGGSGSYVNAAQIWVDRVTGVPLREEGFWDDQCKYVIEYQDIKELKNGSRAPLYVRITLLGKNRKRFFRDVYPWVFAVRFTSPEGKAWLLRRAEVRQGPNGRRTASASATCLRVE